VTAVRRSSSAPRTAALVVAVALAVGGCGSAGSSDAGGPTAGSSVSSPATVPSSGGGPTTPGSPSSGSSDHPVVLTPTTDLLDWHDVPGSTEDTVTVGDGWNLTVVRGGDLARLSGARPRTVPAGPRASIADAFLDETHALVVSEDDLAEASDVATLVDLRTGRVRHLDRSSHPPTSVGGTWALGPSLLAHATHGRGGSYCVAFVALDTGSTEARACVPPHHGFSRAALTPDGETLMRFDAQRPSCRTLLTRTGTTFDPLPGVTPCKGWDSAALPGGTAWSVIPRERRIEVAQLYARTADGWFDLGAGTSGSLVACAGSAYFVRDPATRHDPATLLRFDPADATLATVFASRGRGNAFLSAPRCGGHHLTVTAFAEAGDQQVTTQLSEP
jgi:hypothetical protein